MHALLCAVLCACVVSAAWRSDDIITAPLDVRTQFFAHAYEDPHAAVDEALRLWRSLVGSPSHRFTQTPPRTAASLRHRAVAWLASLLPDPHARVRERAAHTYYDTPLAPLWPDWDYDAAKAQRTAEWPLLNGWEQAMWGPFVGPVHDQASTYDAPALRLWLYEHMYKKTHTQHALLDLLLADSHIPVPPTTASADLVRVREHAVDLLEWVAHTASGRAQSDALWILGEHFFWGTHGATPNVTRARDAYSRLAALHNATAHARLGYLHASTFMAHVFGTEHSMPVAIQHYTIASEHGDWHALNALAFRYAHGFGVPQNCTHSLELYDALARQTYGHFLAGPPGGRHLPYSKARLTDRAWLTASNSVVSRREERAILERSYWVNVLRPAPQQYLHELVNAQKRSELLYHMKTQVDEHDLSRTLEYARCLYYGSLLGDHDALGALRPNWTLAAHLFEDIAKQRYVAPITLSDINDYFVPGEEWQPMLAMKQTPEAETKVASHAAAHLGVMYLRGEGVPQDYKLAKVWLTRAAHDRDPLGSTYLGMMYEYGFGGLALDPMLASTLWSQFGDTVPRATCERGKHLLRTNDTESAHLAFKRARNWIHWSVEPGMPFLFNRFEPYYLSARLSVDKLFREHTYDGCPTWSIDSFKTMTHRADWADPVYHRGEAALDRGDVVTAMRAWSLAAGAGIEEAQENLAYILDPFAHKAYSADKKRRDHAAFYRTTGMRDEKKHWDELVRLAHASWHESAAQGSMYAEMKLCEYGAHGIPSGNASMTIECLDRMLTSHEDRSTSRSDEFLGLVYKVSLYLHGADGLERNFVHAADVCRTAITHTIELVNLSLSLPSILAFVSLLQLYVHVMAFWAMVTQGDPSARQLFASYIHAMPAHDALYKVAVFGVGLCTFAILIVLRRRISYRLNMAQRAREEAAAAPRS